MSRIRTIKPEFWQHPKTARASIQARALFIGMLNEADDEGRLYASPRLLIGAIFPHDNDVHPDTIIDWTEELVEARLVVPYTNGGASYLWIPGFTEHQVISRPKPSRLPPPPGWDHSTNGHGRLRDDSLSPHGAVHDESTQEGNREQGKEGKGESARAARIPTPFIVNETMREWAKENAPRVSYKRETEKFCDYWKSASGRSATKRDWVAAWRNWLRRAQDGF